MGGPESMAGAVVANFDALSGGRCAVMDAEVASPAAVVYFPNDTTILYGRCPRPGRAAAEAFKAQGGQGYVRVVGHSSGRTGNMPVDASELDLRKSQARANAVAQEMIQDGVPPDKVLVRGGGRQPARLLELMPRARWQPACRDILPARLSPAA